ncbi:MAG: hypothetical protein HC888_07375 [Candidatus Competibacteraceae bacterium]|nr:hypothetical protein [Candidatus Competibacteraceae bacterium]
MNGGTLIRVIPKTLFDFGYVPVSTTGSVISFLDSSSTTLTISGTAPTLLNSALSAGVPLPPYLQIEVQGTQPGTATNIGVEISIDLLVRCCG